MVCSKPLRGNFLDPLLVKTLTRIVCGKKKCPKVCVFQRWAFPTVLRRSLHPLWILQGGLSAPNYLNSKVARRAGDGGDYRLQGGTWKKSPS